MTLMSLFTSVIMQAHNYFTILTRDTTPISNTFYVYSHLPNAMEQPTMTLRIIKAFIMTESLLKSAYSYKWGCMHLSDCNNYCSSV